MRRLVSVLLIGNLCLWLYFGLSFVRACEPYDPRPGGHLPVDPYSFWGHAIGLSKSSHTYIFVKAVLSKVVFMIQGKRFGLSAAKKSDVWLACNLRRSPTLHAAQRAYVGYSLIRRNECFVAPKLRAISLVRFRCDRSRLHEAVACIPDISPWSAPRRAPVKIESAPIHHLNHDKTGRMTFSDRAGPA